MRQRKDVVHPHDNPAGAASFVGLEHIETLTGRRTGQLDVEMSFVDDIDPPGVLHAAILRSPYGHALIGGIESKKDMSADDEKALKAAIEDWKKSGTF